MISFYFRFESVHPSIYAIYDLIEHIPDPLLAQQIREHVVCIEGKKYKPFFLRFFMIKILQKQPSCKKYG